MTSRDIGPRAGVINPQTNASSISIQRCNANPYRTLQHNADTMEAAEALLRLSRGRTDGRQNGVAARVATTFSVATLQEDEDEQANDAALALLRIKRSGGGGQD